MPSCRDCTAFSKRLFILAPQNGAFVVGTGSQRPLYRLIDSLIMICSLFVLMSRDTQEDCQLHTLGLLERLRAETRGAEGAYSDLYRRVDKVLRELQNPNLHDIANMNFRVELWDRQANHVRWAVAAASSVAIAHA